MTIIIYRQGKLPVLYSNIRSFDDVLPEDIAEAIGLETF